MARSPWWNSWLPWVGLLSATAWITGCGARADNYCQNGTTCAINLGSGGQGGNDAPQPGPASSAGTPGSTASGGPGDSGGSVASGGSDQGAGSSPSDAPSDSPAATPMATSAPVLRRIGLGTLCNAPDAQAYICGTGYGGTVQVGQQMFQYHGENNGNADAQPPYWDNVLKFPANTCTEIVIHFAIADQESAPGSSANLQLVRTSAAPVEVSTPHGQVGTLTADVNGGAFQLSANASDGAQVYADGYAMCRSDSGE